MCCGAFGGLTPFSLPETVYEGFHFSVNVRSWAGVSVGAIRELAASLASWSAYSFPM